MPTLTDIILAAILYLAAHEGGHFLSALVLRLHPRFGWDGGIAVFFDEPRKWCHGALVGVMGFGGNLLAMLALLVINRMGLWANETFLVVYQAIFVGHFVSYPFRKHGSLSNDFRYLL